METGRSLSAFALLTYLIIYFTTSNSQETASFILLNNKNLSFLINGKKTDSKQMIVDEFEPSVVIKTLPLHFAKTLSNISEDSTSERTKHSHVKLDLHNRQRRESKLHLDEKITNNNSIYIFNNYEDIGDMENLQVEAVTGYEPQKIDMTKTKRKVTELHNLQDSSDSLRKGIATTVSTTGIYYEVPRQKKFSKNLKHDRNIVTSEIPFQIDPIRKVTSKTNDLRNSNWLTSNSVTKTKGLLEKPSLEIFPLSTIDPKQKNSEYHLRTKSPRLETFHVSQDSKTFAPENSKQASTLNSNYQLPKTVPSKKSRTYSPAFNHLPYHSEIDMTNEKSPGRYFNSSQQVNTITSSKKPKIDNILIYKNSANNKIQMQPAASRNDFLQNHREFPKDDYVLEILSKYDKVPRPFSMSINEKNTQPVIHNVTSMDNERKLRNNNKNHQDEYSQHLPIIKSYVSIQRNNANNKDKSTFSEVMPQNLDKSQHRKPNPSIQDSSSSDESQEDNSKSHSYETHESPDNTFTISKSDKKQDKFKLNQEIQNDQHDYKINKQNRHNYDNEHISNEHNSKVNDYPEQDNHDYKDAKTIEYDYDYITDDNSHEPNEHKNSDKVKYEPYANLKDSIDDQEQEDTKAHKQEDHAASQSEKHERKDEDKKFEKESEEQHAEKHYEEDTNDKDKKYESAHEHESAEKGHHDKEENNHHYDEKHGEKKKHNDESDYHGEHYKGEGAKKEVEFNEKGEHQKGHSTKGQHSVHKKDEYEKNVEFFDEFNEEDGIEKEGEDHHEHEGKKGGHYKSGHHHTEHDEGMHGKRQKHEKGQHHHQDKGEKGVEGHDHHHHYEKKHGKKGEHEDKKKWEYKKGDDGEHSKEKDGHKE